MSAPERQAESRLADGIPVWCACDEIVDLATLVRNPRNPNTHPEKQIALLAHIIEAQGWRAPITVSTRSGHIVKGHGRLDAALLLEKCQVPVDFQHYDSDAAELADLVADNRIAELAETDEDMLAALVGDIDLSGLDTTLTGFDDRATQRMLDSLTAALIKDEPPDPPADPVTKPGDLWLLGEHRVLCGDSTKAEDVARLMDGRKAVCMWTDPPYGVEYVGKTKDAKRIANDGAVGLEALLRGAFTEAVASLEEGAPWYCAHPAGAQSQTFESVVAAVGMQVHQGLVWVKDVFVLGHSDYHYKHEPILYGYTPGVGRSGRGNHAGSRWYGDNAQTSVFEVPRPKRSEAHPTMKPVALVARAIENSSRGGELVLDPFLGSGSTLIAAEQTGRVCYGVEIDPAYCDVIVTRWENLTGREAVLDERRDTAQS